MPAEDAPSINEVEQLKNLLTRDCRKANYNVSHLCGEEFMRMSGLVSFRDESYKLSPAVNPEEILSFGDELSEFSREMFCPYPWNDRTQAIEKLGEFVVHHSSGRNLGYLLFHNVTPVAFSFLWDISVKPEGIVVPELGEGVMDAWQGKGIGGFMLDVLTGIAGIRGASCVELTTDLRNDVAKRLYLSRGYEELGIIQNPLEIDQTKSIEEMRGVKTRDEYHMARFFKDETIARRYLEVKRDKQNSFFPDKKGKE